MCGVGGRGEEGGAHVLMIKFGTNSTDIGDDLQAKYSKCVGASFFFFLFFSFSESDPEFPWRFFFF